VAARWLRSGGLWILRVGFALMRRGDGKEALGSKLSAILSTSAFTCAQVISTYIEN